MNHASPHDLEPLIEHWFAQGTAAVGNPDALATFLQLRDALEAGTLRSAEPDNDTPTGWRVNAWVKRGILLGFRLGSLEAMNGRSPGGRSGNLLSFVDKSTFPARHFTPEQGIRIIPGGSSVRSGAFVARGVIIVPPAYINVGSFVDQDSLVDSHALVGSCAQIGKRVHLSAGAQIGGVLEPMPPGSFSPGGRPCTTFPTTPSIRRQPKCRSSSLREPWLWPAAGPFRTDTAKIWALASIPPSL